MAVADNRCMTRTLNALPKPGRQPRIKQQMVVQVPRPLAASIRLDAIDRGRSISSVLLRVIQDGYPNNSTRTHRNGGIS